MLERKRITVHCSSMPQSNRLFNHQTCYWRTTSNVYSIDFVSLRESLGKRNLAENQLACSVKDFTGRKLDFFMHIWAGPRDQKWKKGKIIIPFHLSGITPVFQILGGIHPIKISSLSEAGALQMLAKVTNSGDLCCCLNVPVATTFSQHDLLKHGCIEGPLTSWSMANCRGNPPFLINRSHSFFQGFVVW